MGFAEMRLRAHLPQKTTRLSRSTHRKKIFEFPNKSRKSAVKTVLGTAVIGVSRNCRGKP